MPIAPNTVHCNMVGHLPRGEEFTVGFWLAIAAPVIDFVTANQVAADLAALIEADHDTGPVDLITTNAGYDELRCYFYGATPGDTADYIGAAPLTTMTGQAGGGGMPLQVSLTMTFETGLPGASRRGRCYVPAIGAGLSQGQLTQADLDAQTAWWKNLFDDIAASTDFDANAVVMSRKLGVASAVNAVSADSRLDIQRRRANKESETYQSRAELA